jgi:hypothetical protein
MFRSISGRPGRRLATVVALAGASVVTGSQLALAVAAGSFPEAPGQGDCVSQYADYAVRGDAWATADGAKFKLLRNGSVVANTPTRATNWAVERRTAYGNFPGPGLYSLCAQNTGTRNTVATLQLKTDAEV